MVTGGVNQTEEYEWDLLALFVHAPVKNNGEIVSTKSVNDCSGVQGLQINSCLVGWEGKEAAWMPFVMKCETTAH